MSAKIHEGIVGSNSKVSLYFSIMLCLKLCSSPLSHHCSERAGGVVGFPMDKGALSSCLQT